MTRIITDLSPATYRLLKVNLIYTMFVISLPAMSVFYILGDLGGGLQTASYGVSFFLLGNMATKPLALSLGHRIGRLKLLKICMILMVLTSIPILYVQNYYSFVTIRFIQGVITGPMFLICTSMGGGLLHEKRLDSFIKFILLILITVPVISAGLAAVFSYQYDWRWGFVFNLLYITIITIWTCIHHHHEEIPMTKEPFDWIGFIFFFIGVCSLGFCFITGQTIDWFRSDIFNIGLVTGLICISFYFVWHNVCDHPILQLRLLKHFRFACVMLNILLMYTCYYAVIILLPYWLHLFVNYSVFWVGVSMAGVLIGPIFLIIAYSLGALEQNKVRLWIISISFLILIFSSFYISHFNAEVNLSRIMLAKIIVGIALAIYLPPILFNIQKNSSKEDFSQAFCFFAIFRGLGSLIGTSGCHTLWERRSDFYHSRLGGQFTLFSQKTQLLFDKLNFFHFTPLMKESALNDALTKQATSLALDDCYRLLAWITVVILAYTVGINLVRSAISLRVARHMMPHKEE